MRSLNKLVLSLSLIIICQIIVTCQFRSIIRNDDDLRFDDDHQLDDYQTVLPKSVFPNFKILQEPLPTYAQTLRAYRERARLNRLIKMRLRKLKEFGVMYNFHRLRDLIQKEMELAMDPVFRKSFFNKNFNNFEKFDELAKDEQSEEEDKPSDENIKVIAILLKTNQTETVDKEQQVQNDTVKDEAVNKINQDYDDVETLGKNLTVPMTSFPEDGPLFVYKTTRIASRNRKNFRKMVERFRNARLRKFEAEEKNIESTEDVHPTKLETFLESIKQKSN